MNLEALFRTPVSARWFRAAIVAYAVGGVASAATIKLPAETAVLQPANLPGFQLASALCTICHSVDYIRYQPTLSRAAWTAEVTKMQKTYGAPLPPTAIDPIVDYLSRTYGAERLTSPPGAPTPARK